MLLSNPFDLSGQRALITGSSRGLGYAMARGLAQAGASVVLNGRDNVALGNAAADLAAEGANVTALAFDVTSPDSVEAAIDHCESEIGPIDILVNNAGIQIRGSLENFRHDDFERMLSAHVVSTFSVSQMVARHMIGRGRGKIINICSVLTNVARPTVAPYSAAKAAIANLTRGMAADWAPKGLHINAIAPGYFKTELNQALMANPEFNAWVENRTPMGRWGDVAELGPVAVFLASNASSYINGHILYVDGAFTAVV
ncbi:SDR family oxidoreductase [Devosia sp. SD17-2]|jgi:gluconate 5-dehydrogenase|uniref:SDR family oxidoreductase n=1 Tax=Devosia sp. SD17-2 TaxID=2976459 RepID=UPI0023D80AFC|nr:SDR family oxidoreductase [Devosia sp. SD17-2]WEJ34905.1 SDR family oxidoreductase [Devosia sp. SD17-2]